MKSTMPKLKSCYASGEPWFPLAKNMKRILKRPLLNILENHAIAYPTPSNISYL